MPSKISPKPEPALEDAALKLSNQLCFAVYSTALAFNSVYKPLLDKLGLTYPQYLAMLVLWEHDDVPVKDIGHALHLDSGTLTPLLKRLELAGLVRRKRSTLDERQVRITLTADGRKLRDKAKAVPMHIMQACARSTPALLELKDELLTLRDQLNGAR